MRILVCGGRDLKCLPKDAEEFIRALPRASTIIEGGARGADSLARQLAVSLGLPYITYAADWKQHSRAAGPIRNQRMLDEGKPDVVVAIPTKQSRGTWDMVRRAKSAGLTVKIYRGEN